jgi:hypothetical protein
MCNFISIVPSDKQPTEKKFNPMINLYALCVQCDLEII